MAIYRFLAAFAAALTILAHARVTVTFFAMFSGVPVAVPVPWIIAAGMVTAAAAAIWLLVRRIRRQGFTLYWIAPAEEA
jgi:hypothetical protein